MHGPDTLIEESLRAAQLQSNHESSHPVDSNQLEHVEL